MSHKDINGKKIQLGDVVVIHGNSYYHEPRTQQRAKRRAGELGIVIGWGCVKVELKRCLILPNYGPWDYFNSQDLETLGQL